MAATEFRRSRSSVLGSKETDKTSARALFDDTDHLADVLESYATNSIPGLVFPDVSVPTGVAQYTQVSAEDMKVEGVGVRSEHSEYPMVRFTPGDLKKAHTSDIGGKFRVSDEAIDAGDTSLIEDGLSLLGTSINDTLNTMMVEALAQVTDEKNGGLSIGANSFHGVTLDGANPTPAEKRPWASIVAARGLLRKHGLSANANVLLLDWDSADALTLLYDQNNLEEQWGLTIYGCDKLPEGTGYLLDARHFGKLVTKDGLQVETWRDPSIRATWCQSYIEPVITIQRPRNVVRLFGLGLQD
ncbi:major capsid protein [Corynebacterium sp. LaCa116]|uniref:major capsid protein n=1 Tax=Corynebacterium sp. LaCa116 TaxID=3391423 RepID=UPI0039895255